MKSWQSMSQNIKQNIKRRWQKKRNKRLLRAYYRRHNLVEARAPRLSRHLFIFLVILLLLFWFAPTLKIVGGGIIVVLTVLVLRCFFKRQSEDLRLKKACFQKIARQEFQKRLAQTPPDVFLKIVQAEIYKQYKIKPSNERWF